MNKIKEATIVLTKAMKDLYQITPALSICGYKDDKLIEITAHLNKKDFEEAFVDQSITIKPRPNYHSGDYPFEKSVVVGEVKFFCLLTEGEKEEGHENSNT